MKYRSTRGIKFKELAITYIMENPYHFEFTVGVSTELIIRGTNRITSYEI